MQEILSYSHVIFGEVEDIRKTVLLHREVNEGHDAAEQAIQIFWALLSHYACLFTFGFYGQWTQEDGEIVCAFCAVCTLLFGAPHVNLISRRWMGDISA